MNFQIEITGFYGFVCNQARPDLLIKNAVLRIADGALLFLDQNFIANLYDARGRPCNAFSFYSVLRGPDIAGQKHNTFRDLDIYTASLNPSALRIRALIARVAETSLTERARFLSSPFLTPAVVTAQPESEALEANIMHINVQTLSLWALFF